jgi:hypothetical protein
MSEPIGPSVWRSARWNTARSVSAVRMANNTWLAAPVRPRLGPPGGNRLLAEPHRQIATLAQACFVGWPIRQPTLLLRDMVATLGVGLERHGGHPGSGLRAAFYPTQPRRQTSNPCNARLHITLAGAGAILNSVDDRLSIYCTSSLS